MHTYDVTFDVLRLPYFDVSLAVNIGWINPEIFPMYELNDEKYTLCWQIYFAEKFYLKPTIMKLKILHDKYTKYYKMSFSSFKALNDIYGVWIYWQLK